jgi:hypothetical protein
MIYLLARRTLYRIDGLSFVNWLREHTTECSFCRSVVLFSLSSSQFSLLFLSNPVLCWLITTSYKATVQQTYATSIFCVSLLVWFSSSSGLCSFVPHREWWRHHKVKIESPHFEEGKFEPRSNLNLLMSSSWLTAHCLNKIIHWCTICWEKTSLLHHQLTL